MKSPGLFPSSNPLHAPVKIPVAHGAFTLCELVVIGAVVFVSGLFLAPAIAHSKGPSLRAYCLNNLRQLMQGCGMYAMDNRDYLPFPNWGNSMPGWLYTPVMTAPPAGTDPASANGLLYPYVRKTPPYRCPLDTVTGPYWLARANKFSTYVMNGAVCGYGSLLNSSYRLNQFKPEAYCLWEPDEDLGGIGAFAYNDASSYPDRNEGPGRKHAGGTTIGTFGGNAVFPAVSYFTSLQSGTGPNLLWCNPGSSNGR